jgi:uncharacterized damage-inducible protein DinB
VNAPLAELFRYNRWANLTLLDSCDGLPETTLAARPPGISGSVGELLLHIVGAQQTFVLRTMGRQHEGEFTRGSAWPGFSSLRTEAERSSDDLIAIAASLDADVPVDLPYLGRAYRFPKSFFLLHALEHGVEHRTEVKVALAQLGIETPDLDAWSYAPVAGFGQAVP